MAIDQKLMDRVADALNRLGSVSVIRDTVIPGCPHFGDRIVIHFRVKDDALWSGLGGHLRTVLKLVDQERPWLNVHICRQWLLDAARPKELLVLQTFEVEGNEVAVEQVVSVLEQCRQAKADPRVPMVSIEVGGSDGRSKELNSERYGPANLKSGGTGAGGVR